MAQPTHPDFRHIPTPAVLAPARQPDPTHSMGQAAAGIFVGVAGVVAGGLVGMVFGPAGAVFGAAIGAITGAIFGAAFVRFGYSILSPDDEEEYWQNNFVDQPYFINGMSWDDYGPAYRLGWETRDRNRTLPFEQAEPLLREHWERHRKTSRLNWNQARPAIKDAWDRIPAGK